MKVKYIGPSFGDGVWGLTDGKIYECLGEEYGFLRVIDDEGEDYLYSASEPMPLDGSVSGGKWVIVEDDENKTLSKAIPTA